MCSLANTNVLNICQLQNQCRRVLSVFRLKEWIISEERITPYFNLRYSQQLCITSQLMKYILRGLYTCSGFWKAVFLETGEMRGYHGSTCIFYHKDRFFWNKILDIQSVFSAFCQYVWLEHLPCTQFWICLFAQKLLHKGFLVTAKPNQKNQTFYQVQTKMLSTVLKYNPSSCWFTLLSVSWDDIFFSSYLFSH